MNNDLAISELMGVGAGGQSGLQTLYGTAQYYPSACYYPTPVQEREPRAFELTIERVGNMIRIDYGAELRLLMAEPIKGMHLRDAIQKLKEALLEG